MPHNTPPQELVLLTHGIASARWFLWPLARRLRKAGFQTQLHGYPSLWWSNRSHGRKLAEVLRRAAPHYDRVHLVVHSMGSIVTRCALEEDLPTNFGRVVMIAPPNGGSGVATKLVPLLGWLSPTLVELQDTPDSFVNQLGPLPADTETGIIAAERDGKVRLEQTHVTGQTDHCTTSGWHTDVLWTRETARLTTRFLQEGRFSPEQQG